MTDLTPLFDRFLSTHSVPPTTGRTFSVDSLDEFLKEAYTINNAIRTLHTDLLRIRQSYLSTAQPRRTLIRQNGEKPLTNREREEIDANSKKLLRDLNAKMIQLKDAEQVRRDTETQVLKRKFGRGLSVLGSWASGGVSSGFSGKSVEYRRAEEAANTINTHRESVLWMLNKRLKECLDTQEHMMEVRLNREIEKQRSVLARAGVNEGMGGPGVVPGLSTREPSSSSSKRRSSRAAGQNESSFAIPQDEEQSAGNAQAGLSPEQIQTFEKENHDMLQHYESVLGQVRTAEKSLIEISELQTQLVNNLATQSAHIDQLVADSENITEDVGGGNKQLKAATKKPSPAKHIFYATCGLCTLLVVWDLLI